MKKLLVLILFLFAFPANAQEKIYLPMIFNAKTIKDEIWKVISPVESTNYVLNPSGETISNYAALGTATVSRSTTFQLHGLYSYWVRSFFNGDGISLTLSPLTNAVHTVSFRVRGQLPPNLRCILGSSIKTPELVEHINPFWDLYSCNFSASSGQTILYIIQQGEGAGNFYLDGIQVEALPYWTTFIDGDQDGCSWNGTEHASTSTRSGLSLAGGQVKDLYKDYGFFVQKNLGAGMASNQINMDDYSVLPGGEINSIKILSRDFVLAGKFIADSESELYQNRKSLLQLLRKNNRNQQLKWRVYHPNEIREITAVYNGGLEGDGPVYYDNFFAEEDSRWAEVNQFVEPAALQLKAPDPYFYQIGNSAALLDTNDTTEFRTVAARLKSTGQWSNLGPPSSSGTYTSVLALAEDDTYIYIGGDFQNFDNIAAADYIVRYHKLDGTYSALGSGLNNVVSSLEIGPDGELYIGGAFTNAGGVAAADYLTVWDGTSFAAVGNPNSGTASITTVNALKFDNTGILYIGGVFLNWAGNASSDFIASWNGTSYSNLSTGANNAVRSLGVGLDNTLYLGGDFTTLGGGSISRIGSWDGTSFSSMGDANSTVYAIAIDHNNGLVYIAGVFSTIGGVSAGSVAVWNGISMAALGSGLSDTVLPFATASALAVGNDGIVWIGGQFDTAGGVSLADGITRWNGYAFGHLDVDFVTGSSSVSAIILSKSDPVIKQKYDVWVGGSFIWVAGNTSAFGGKITVTNDGNANAFPRIIYSRSGGTSVTIETFRNETTGKELLFNYSLLDGERLTIDLRPSQKSIISNFYGSRLDAILANSDFGLWTLEPGNNDVTSFVDNSNIALYPSEITAWIEWKTPYASFD